MLNDANLKVQTQLWQYMHQRLVQGCALHDCTAAGMEVMEASVLSVQTLSLPKTLNSMRQVTQRACSRGASDICHLAVVVR